MKVLSAATALQLTGYKPAKVVGERHLDAAQARRMSCPDCGPTGCATTPTSVLPGRHTEASRGARNA